MSYTKLRVGDVVQLGDGEHIVTYVNDCRAACIPLTEREVRYKTVEGRVVQFDAATRSVNISPNSDCPIVRRLGQSGMAKFFEERKAEKRKQREERAQAEGRKPKGPRLGQLGGFLGFAVTRVIRAMSNAGWKETEIKQVLSDNKVDATERTIHQQVRRAQKGGKAAPIDAKQLAALRPKTGKKK